jgi:hypothetical protein
LALLGELVPHFTETNSISDVFTQLSILFNT